MIGAFIFSSTYNSTLETFNLSVNHSGILELTTTQKLNKHDPKICLKYNLRAKSWREEAILKIPSAPKELLDYTYLESSFEKHIPFL